MPARTISIPGCGWLGLPLAKHLLEKSRIKSFLIERSLLNDPVSNQWISVAMNCPGRRHPGPRVSREGRDG